MTFIQYYEYTGPDNLMSGYIGSDEADGRDATHALHKGWRHLPCGCWQVLNAELIVKPPSFTAACVCIREGWRQNIGWWKVSGHNAVGRLHGPVAVPVGDDSGHGAK